MPNVSVTNSFTAGTTAVASQVNTNFSDITTYINDRNSGAIKWEYVYVSGNASIDGTLTVNGVAIDGNSGADGWSSAGETWTYATSSTFTISGDKTEKYSVGDKIKLTQTTVKYFYVTAVAYSAPDTTITVCAGDVYSLANAAITTPLFSKMISPNGFPASFTLTPNFVTAFSGTPSVAISFSIAGRLITFDIRMSGTSNSTVTLIGLLTNLTLVNSGTNSSAVGKAIDSGSYINGVTVSNSTTDIVFLKSLPSGTWTASGTKAVYCMYQTYI